MLFFSELTVMHKVKTQRSGELFVKNMLIFCFYMVIIRKYKVKKFFNKFPNSHTGGGLLILRYMYLEQFAR